MKVNAALRQRLIFGGLALIYLAVLLGLAIGAPYLAVIPLFALMAVILRASFFEIMRFRFWPPRWWVFLVFIITNSFLIFYGAWVYRLAGPFLWCLLAHINLFAFWELVVLNTHLKNPTVHPIKNQPWIIAAGYSLIVAAGALLVLQALHIIAYPVLLYVLGCAFAPLALGYWGGIIFYKKHDSHHSQYQYANT